MSLPIRVTKPEWSVYKICGEAALNTYGKLYDYNFTSRFLTEQYNLFLGPKSDFNSTCVFVSKSDNEIVGVIAGCIIGNVVTEVCWYVKPNHRKDKHGIKLLKALEGWGRERRARYISVSRYIHDKKSKNYKAYKQVLLKELTKNG